MLRTRGTFEVCWWCCRSRIPLLLNRSQSRDTTTSSNVVADNSSTSDPSLSMAKLLTVKARREPGISLLDVNISKRVTTLLNSLHNKSIAEVISEESTGDFSTDSLFRRLAELGDPNHPYYAPEDAMRRYMESFVREHVLLRSGGFESSYSPEAQRMIDTLMKDVDKFLASCNSTDGSSTFRQKDWIQLLKVISLYGDHNDPTTLSRAWKVIGAMRSFGHPVSVPILNAVLFILRPQLKSAQDAKEFLASMRKMRVWPNAVTYLYLSEAMLNAGKFDSAEEFALWTFKSVNDLPVAEFPNELSKFVARQCEMKQRIMNRYAEIRHNYFSEADAATQNRAATVRVVESSTQRVPSDLATSQGTKKGRSSRKTKRFTDLDYKPVEESSVDQISLRLQQFELFYDWFHKKIRDAHVQIPRETLVAIFFLRYTRRSLTSLNARYCLSSLWKPPGVHKAEPIDTHLFNVVYNQAVVTAPLDDPKELGAIVDLYEEAQRRFGVSPNAMSSALYSLALIKANLKTEAIAIIESTDLDSVMSVVWMRIALAALRKPDDSDVELATKLLNHSLRNLDVTGYPYIANSLVQLYLKGSAQTSTDLQLHLLEICKERIPMQLTFTVDPSVQYFHSALMYARCRIVETLLVEGKVDEAVEYYENTNECHWPFLMEQDLTTIGQMHTHLVRMLFQYGYAQTALSVVTRFINVPAIHPFQSYFAIIGNLCMYNEIAAALEVIDLVAERKAVLQPELFSPILRTYLQKGQLQDAFSLLQRMKDLGVDPGQNFGNIIMDGFVRAGEMRQARGLLKQMLKSDGAADIATFNTLLNGVRLRAMNFTSHRYATRALREAKVILAQMRGKMVAPDERTTSIMIGIYRVLNMIDQARTVLDLPEFPVNAFAFTNVLQFYLDIGDRQSAFELIRQMRQGKVVVLENGEERTYPAPTLETYTMVISSLCRDIQSNDHEEAFVFLNQMLAEIDISRGVSQSRLPIRSRKMSSRDRKLLAQSLCAMAEAAGRRGELGRALAYLDEVQPRMISPQVERLVPYAVLGAFHDSGNYHEAIRYWENVVNGTLDKVQFPPSEAWAASVNAKHMPPPWWRTDVTSRTWTLRSLTRVMSSYAKLGHVDAVQATGRRYLHPKWDNLIALQRLRGDEPVWLLRHDNTYLLSDVTDEGILPLGVSTGAECINPKYLHSILPYYNVLLEAYARAGNYEENANLWNVLWTTRSKRCVGFSPLTKQELNQVRERLTRPDESPDTKAGEILRVGWSRSVPTPVPSAVVEVLKRRREANDVAGIENNEGEEERTPENLNRLTYGVNNVTVSLRIDCLAEVGRYSLLRGFWSDVLATGYPVDTNNWTSYLEGLVRCGEGSRAVDILVNSAGEQNDLSSHRLLPYQVLVPDAKSFVSMFVWMKKHDAFDETSYQRLWEHLRGGSYSDQFVRIVGEAYSHGP
ncbi:hypothetical protein BJ742DRAFT_790867 [Cladochytrium replicatum]|nr:hypothetical protein BJ742DRAFT_790867 [Cladochytrium replicatum]